MLINCREKIIIYMHLKTLFYYTLLTQYLKFEMTGVNYVFIKYVSYLINDWMDNTYKTTFIITHLVLTCALATICTHNCVKVFPVFVFTFKGYYFT